MSRVRPALTSCATRVPSAAARVPSSCCVDARGVVRGLDHQAALLSGVPRCLLERGVRVVSDAPHFSNGLRGTWRDSGVTWREPRGTGVWSTRLHCGHAARRTAARDTGRGRRIRTAKEPCSTRQTRGQSREGRRETHSRRETRDPRPQKRRIDRVARSHAAQHQAPPLYSVRPPSHPLELAASRTETRSVET